MQSSYPDRFEREMACTEAEWLRWLPQAIGTHVWTMGGDAADVRIADGALMVALQPTNRFARIEIGGEDVGAESVFDPFHVGRGDELNRLRGEAYCHEWSGF